MISPGVSESSAPAATGDTEIKVAKPAVSVVVPVYNRALVLPCALKSVLAQTMQDFEVVVVDDGSVDDLALVVASLSDSRIRLIRHSENMGTAAARNTGVQTACGEYIAFLDSDDLWEPAKLERQLAALNDAGDGVIAITTGFVMAREKNGMRVLRQPRDADGPERFLSGCDVSPGSTLMVRRRLFDQVGQFDTGFTRLEDWDWLLKALQWGRLIVLPEPLAVIMVGKRPALSKVQVSIARLLDQNLSWLTRRNPANRRPFLSACYYELSAAAYWEGAILTAIKYYIVHLYFSPLRKLPGRLLRVLNVFS